MNKNATLFIFILLGLLALLSCKDGKEQHLLNSIEQTWQLCEVSLPEAQVRVDALKDSVGNATYFIIDFDTHEMLSRSDKMLYLEDVSDNERQRESKNPYWSFVDEETLKKLLLIRNNYPLVGRTIDIADYPSHICTIDYPIIIKQRKFYINQKFTPLVMRSDGITKIGLFIISPSTSDHMESFIITQSRIRYRFDFNAGVYKAFNLNAALSIQEKMALQRVQKGYTIEEIAEDLHLSISTIKTHRSRIFKKLQVRTMPEALTVIGNYHLI